MKVAAPASLQAYCTALMVKRKREIEESDDPGAGATVTSLVHDILPHAKQQALKQTRYFEMLLAEAMKPWARMVLNQRHRDPSTITQAQRSLLIPGFEPLGVPWITAPPEHFEAVVGEHEYETTDQWRHKPLAYATPPEVKRFLVMMDAHQKARQGTIDETQQVYDEMMSHAPDAADPAYAQFLTMQARAILAGEVAV